VFALSETECPIKWLKSIHEVNVSLVLRNALCMCQWAPISGSIPSPRQRYKFSKKSLENRSCSSNTHQSYTTLYYSLSKIQFYIPHNHFLSSVKMQLTQIFSIFAVAVASVAAAPDRPLPPPPPSVSQQQVLS
jgi:hypothetical protein